MVCSWMRSLFLWQSWLKTRINRWRSCSPSLKFYTKRTWRWHTRLSYRSKEKNRWKEILWTCLLRMLASYQTFTFQTPRVTGNTRLIRSFWIGDFQTWWNVKANILVQENIKCFKRQNADVWSGTLIPGELFCTQIFVLVKPNISITLWTRYLPPRPTMWEKCTPFKSIKWITLETGVDFRS